MKGTTPGFYWWELTGRLYLRRPHGEWERFSPVSMRWLPALISRDWKVKDGTYTLIEGLA